MILKPQPGFQEQFLASPADIVIGGGAAGSGKTFVELLESLRHKDHEGFRAVFFRRTTTQIMSPGGLWDSAMKIFPGIGAECTESKRRITFPSGVTIKFEHLEYEKDKYNWQGSEIPLIIFDELPHFTWGQFTYMLSRNRSTCGVKPYIRATCNPDSDSWVREVIDWWIDGNGYVIKERCGIIRYFTVDSDNIVWGDSPQEVVNKCPHIFSNKKLQEFDIKDLVKSLTFIEGDIYENKALLETDPAYLGNLLALPTEEKKRLLEKNWNIKVDGLMLADHHKVTDIFTNQIRPNPSDGCITIDHARFGQDLMVSTAWHGWYAKRIDILTKSDTNDIVKVVNHQMFHYRIGSSSILVDQDGIGVKDHYQNCTVFYGGGKTIGENKDHYANLKTECSYYLCEKIINENLMYIDLDNIYVDGIPAKEVKIGSKNYQIKEWILKQLRTIRQQNVNKLGRKQIESKDEQKNKLNGRSPDFADNFLMRSWFDLRGKRQYLKRKS